jgi:predicted peptidase
MALLDRIIARHTIDTTRLYLTGLSMGGFGAWYLAAAHPQRFAAIAPICGGGVWAHGFPEKVRALKDTPVWAFHGAKDNVVPPSESKKLAKLLRACGGNVRLTIYPNVKHDSWTQTYANPKLYEWFLQHTRE